MAVDGLGVAFQVMHGLLEFALTQGSKPSHCECCGRHDRASDCTTRAKTTVPSTKWLSDKVEAGLFLGIAAPLILLTGYSLLVISGLIDPPTWIG